MRASLIVTLTALSVVACSGDDEGGDGNDEGGTGDESVSGDGDGDGAPIGGDGDGDSNDPSGGDGDVGTGADPGDVSEPAADHCAESDSWDSGYAQLEQEVLEAVNVERAAGASCGGRNFEPTHPLVMDPALQCAARLHSKDMADRGYFSHDTPDGVDPWKRIEDAGFQGFGAGENIAAGRQSAEETVAQWMGSTGHCSNIMSPDFEFIGVGYFPGGEFGHLWTQTFGRSSGR